MQQSYQCPSCGAPVAFGQRFCENCGAQLSYPPQQQPPPSQYQQQPPTQPYYQQQPSYKQEAPKPQKRGGSPWAIIGVLVALLVVTGGIFAVFRMDLGSSSLPSLPFTGQGSSDTIELPWGSTIKVVFNGPPELDVEWEKLGMADALGSQLHVIGNVKNVSSQSVRFSDINYYLDGYQVAFTNYGLEGQTLYPGETIEIMKGITGFTEYTKVLEVRIVGFQKVGGTVLQPEPPQTSTPTTASTPTPTPPATVITSYPATTYTNDKYGFSIQYPKDWVARPELITTPYYLAAFGIEGFVPGVVCMVFDKPEATTKDWIVSSLKSTGTAMPKVTSEVNEITLSDGTKAYVYTAGYVSPTGYDVVAYCLDAVKGDRQFRINVFTVDSFFPYDGAMFSEIAKTLTFGGA
jgi:hypothetical protein